MPEIEPAKNSGILREVWVDSRRVYRGRVDREVAWKMAHHRNVHPEIRVIDEPVELTPAEED